MTLETLRHAMAFLYSALGPHARAIMSKAILDRSANKESFVIGWKKFLGRRGFGLMIVFPCVDFLRPI